VIFSAEDAYLELAHGGKTLIVPVLEVNEAHRRAFFARLPVLADAGVFQQQVEGVTVVLDQAGAGEARRQPLDRFFNLVIFKPGIDNLQLLAQHWEHDNFCETLAVSLGRKLLAVAVDHGPAKTL
jgi:hypothetical protein